ncbi:hypothetical protein GCM10027280_07160 [Micromonospora polyrhachis]|uniref:DUF4132 domain-containing protein n=1 Tax=Micromonospora polyrhachis TaxID=1282883 RepID=A0A7W7WM87_9ACTN|nr:DUF4132 domain-containing protein [Micromonospora polyrhachis]MBB4956372.1 hypothetical protein [Micromonospora polyrhachis]
MPKFVLPDEDAWVLPNVWRKVLHPRRGGHPAPERTIPLDADVRLRTRLRSDEVSRSLARASERDVLYDPALLAEGQRYLRSWRELDDPGDEANVVGAAVATVLISRDYETPTCSVDVWVSRYGIEFAARVIGEMTRLVVDRSLWAIDPRPEKTYESLWRGDDRNSLVPMAHAVRTQLAVVTDAEYERVCEILGEYRTSPVGRIVTSYLVPTQVAWVDEDCAAAAAWSADPEGEGFGRDNYFYLSGLLFLAASTVHHLELLDGNIRDMAFVMHLFDRTAGPVSTVLDGVGPAAAPILINPFYRNLLRLGDDKWKHRERLGLDGIRMLSLIPTDEAFRLLCRAALAEESVRPGALLKSGVLSRYPVRALRILSELEAAPPAYKQWHDRQVMVNPQETALYTDLLGTQVLADPQLLPAATTVLPAEARARAEEIVASGGAGIGAGWAALLDRHEQTRYYNYLDSADDEKRAVAALAAIPTEEALGRLVDRVARKYFRPALLTATKRDPQLALRVLLAKSAEAVDADATVSELLRNHVLAYPEAVADALPALDAAARARVEAILASAATPSTGGTVGATLPVLAGPPRKPDGKPMRVPELPEWLVIAALPAVRLADGGEVLSPDAVRQLCALLAVSKITAPHPGIAEVRALCEPHSLAAFAWTIFEQWQAAQYPAKSQFAMVALALIGNDTIVPALTSLFPAWATGSSLRVRTGMDVLAAIGTDLALTALHRLSRKAKTSGFRRFAEQRINAAAEARGLQPAQLADRIVPDLGFDTDARTTLDYGPRQFTVGLDAQLQPWITDQNGKRLTRMPRPAATDDQTLAPAAQQRFTDLKKEVKTIAADRTRALEEAMVTGRRWTAEEFQRLFVQHPLMWQLTHRLLWATFDEQGTVVTMFRPAEDRTLADIDDKTVPLDPTATVGIVHPWHFTDDRETWTTVFADYAITQPFPQLTREMINLSEAEANAELSSFVGISVEGRKLFALTAQGWRRYENDYHSAVLRDWPGDRTVEIEYSPGFHWQEPDAAQKLTRVRVWTTSVSPDGAAGRDQAEDPARFADLGPIAISEVVRDLRFLSS